MFTVIRIDHDVCQHEVKLPRHLKPTGPQKAPHWLPRGESAVATFKAEEEARLYSNRLQQVVDIGSFPFRFTTFVVRKEGSTV
jgi:hypothetical protein